MDWRMNDLFPGTALSSTELSLLRQRIEGLLQGEAERAERDERAECIQIARAHQHIIEPFDPPDQIRLATYSNGTCELIARAIRARESQPVAPATPPTEECPTCKSPAPELHPLLDPLDDFGSVIPCEDPFHSKRGGWRNVDLAISMDPPAGPVPEPVAPAEPAQAVDGELSEWHRPHRYRGHSGDARDCTAYRQCHMGACFRSEDHPIHAVVAAPLSPSPPTETPEPERGDVEPPDPELLKALKASLRSAPAPREKERE